MSHQGQIYSKATPLTLVLPSLGLHKAVSGIQEGRPDRCSPAGKRPLSAPSHAKIELLWKSTDEFCWLRISNLQYHLILTALNCDRKENWPSCSHTCRARQMLRLMGESPSNKRSRTCGENFLWPVPGCFLCLPGLDQWMDSEHLKGHR